MSLNNTTIANVVYPVANAGVSTNPFVDAFHTRDPNGNDLNYPIQKKWLNTSTGSFWMLEGFTSLGSVVQAIWIKIGSVLLTETLTGNTGGPVPPTANNINVVGDGTTITTAGTPATSTLTISVAGGVATTYDCNTGSAAPSGGILNVLGGTAISTTGSGDTITINAADDVATTYTANIGSATPSGNNLNVIGGTGISTSGSGSTLTINSTGSGIFNWSDESGAFNALAFNGYFIIGAATATLPASPVEGTTIAFVVDTASTCTITANTGQQIRVGKAISAVAGTCANTMQGDSIVLVFRTADTTWFSLGGCEGTWTLT